MSKKKTQLVASSVRYGSRLDECMFFAWLDRIECVVEYHGEVRNLFITLKDEAIDEECLRELLALFNRYHVEMSQLASFETDSNRFWFRDPRKYWYERVFGHEKREDK